jgi:hypothetical protein
VDALPGLRAGICCQQEHVWGSVARSERHAFARADLHLSRRKVGDDHDQATDQRFGAYAERMPAKIVRSSLPKLTRS